MYNQGIGKCRVMFTSEYKDEAADFTNLWIMGEPFLKAYYTIYSLDDAQIALVRVADKTHDRYNIKDGIQPKCSSEEAKDETVDDRVITCGSLDISCYDTKYNNELCHNKFESCGKFFNDNQYKVGCILSEHCSKSFNYFGAQNTLFECPDGVKEIHYHQPLGFMFNYESNEQSTRIRNEKRVVCANGQERLDDGYCGDNFPKY